MSNLPVEVVNILNHLKKRKISELPLNDLLRVTENGKVIHIEDLLNDLKKLSSNANLHDKRIVVDGTKFEVVGAILASRSDYFNALLYGGLKESGQDEISLKNTSPAAFTAILEYIYTGTIDLSTLDLNIVLDILSSCHEWQLDKLLKSVVVFVGDNIKIENYRDILDIATLLGLGEILKKCEIFFDSNSDEIFCNESFKGLSTASLLELIKKKTLYKNEVIFFNAITTWMKDVPKEDADLVLNEIRLEYLNPIFLLRNVQKLGLFSNEKIMNAALSQYEDENLYKKFNEIFHSNYATWESGATLVKGKGDAILNGNANSTSSTCHDYPGSIIVSLKEIYPLRSIQIKLYDAHGFRYRYKYKLEISKDGSNFEIITNNPCKWFSNWQKYELNARPVKFIKLTGIDGEHSNAHKDSELLRVCYLKAI